MQAPPTVCVRQGMGKASEMGTTRGSGATGAESSNAARGDEEAEAAEKPRLLSALKLAFTNFRTHNMTDRGASLTEAAAGIEGVLEGAETARSVPECSGTSVPSADGD